MHVADVEMHILKHQLEALKTRGALAVEGNCIKSWSDTAWQRSSHTSIRHWIFTPSHGRASLPRQAFLDWSQAVTSGVQFVRVLVVRREDAEAYMQLVQDLSASENTEQFTLLMVMPEKLSLKRLGAAGRLSEAYASAIAQPGHSVGSSLGVGYARLFVQLVAHALSLTDVWMLDDNVQDCWKLDLEAESLRERRQHGQLQQCTFDNVMRDIEQFTSATQDGVSVTQDVPLDPPAQRMWNSMVSPRAAELQVDEHSQGDVQHWTDFGGSHKHVGIIGPSRQPYRHSLVGAKWAGGAGPPPFKVTHSLFCFYLLNVEATCSKQPMVLWPARQYAEDIEFHHMCEDHQLAVLKCNRFFFHKTNLQGRELAKAADATRSEPDFMFLPAEGPMWGGQQLQIQLVNQQDYASSATICGVPVQLPLSQPNSLQLTVQTPPLHEAPILAQSSSPEVLSGLIKLSFEGGSVLWSSQRYRYHGLWSWPQGISARDDIICSDPGAFEEWTCSSCVDVYALLLLCIGMDVAGT